MEYDDKEEEKDDLELLEGVVDSLCPYQKSSRICNPRWKTANSFITNVVVIYN